MIRKITIVQKNGMGLDSLWISDGTVSALSAAATRILAIGPSSPLRTGMLPAIPAEWREGAKPLPRTSTKTMPQSTVRPVPELPGH
ncbi:hypothetical protein [Rhizobium sp. RU20A]|uniref:hypothetical protein n=1 Tax=Rhizobium sp. RU20A TaxID=1907412 RepID=UPI00165EFE0C|nr:hypothetical protein [Rhizobium sp. RU20A]